MKTNNPNTPEEGNDGGNGGGHRAKWSSSAAATMPVGILRLGDLGKVASGTSLSTAARLSPMEMNFLSLIDQPSSPQPSIDRLSVTFADDITDLSPSEPEAPSKDSGMMDKVHFPNGEEVVVHSDEDDDYSGSVMAIMQRRASTRRSKKSKPSGSRRGSSPFSPDILPDNESRRRSSVFTTSSGDTAITMEDSYNAAATQEQIFENLKLHKEVLANVKFQPWNMRRKLRLVTQAKSYIKQHEGALQERLAQSHSTKDMLARWNIYLVKKLQKLRREMANLSNWLIPWEKRIKQIESHFGSVVASYFIFLRWLFWVNIAISSTWIAFVAVPEMLTADYQPDRKSILKEDKYNATNFLTLWDFEGVFKYSPMFYGWYTNAKRTERGGAYSLPLAYFFTGLAVYIFSFVATLRKMAENSRMSKLSEKEDECIFSWKLFTGWDYMIGNAETAHNRVASIIMGFKEALLEEAEKKREAQSWKTIGSRILVNMAVLSLLGLSAYAVITVVERSHETGATSTTWRRNEITVVMSLITLFFPIFFELLGYFEHYHPRKQLRLQLARIMVLNLLNLYSLIFALFGKISDMTTQLQGYKLGNETTSTVETFTAGSLLAAQALPLQVGNLLSELIENITFILPNYTGIEVDLENLTQSFWANMTTSKPMGSMDAEDYELDFSSVQLAFEELLTTIIDVIENTGYALNETTTATIETFVHLNTSLAEFFENLSTSTTLEDYFSTSSTMEFSSPTSPTPDQSTALSELTSATTKQSTTLKPTIRPAKQNTSDYSYRSHLRSLCWETMFGQELVKLTIMDLVMTLLSILTIDFFRGLFVRYMNNCWCWDLEKKFPQYGDFKVAENILHLVNNQGMVWMGMFFSPGLVVINVAKLYIMMYIRSWAVLTCNVPHEVIFRASRSNNFYYALLLMMLFLCVLPVSYTIVWLEPSWHCGPFSGYHRILNIFTTTLRALLPKSTHKILEYIASPGIVIPLLMLLILIIYYLLSLSAALREANNDLKIQLLRERTEERRKMFQIAHKRLEPNTPFGKWKKLLQGIPSRSFDEAPKQESVETPPLTKQEVSSDRGANQGSLSKFILKAIKNRHETHPILKQTDVKTSIDDPATNKLSGIDVPNVKESTITLPVHEDPSNTDSEQHDSLPDDALHLEEKSNERKKKILTKTTDLSRKDSIASNWSENIPVITISKTESSECILEDKNNKIKIDIEKSSSDNRKPQIRYVLKKQTVIERAETATNNIAKADNESATATVEKSAKDLANLELEEANAIGIRVEQKHTAEAELDAANAGEQKLDGGKEIAEAAPSAAEKSEIGRVASERFQAAAASNSTRTESSTDYRDSTFSN